MLSDACCLSPVVRRPLSVARCPSPVVRFPLSVARCPSQVVRHWSCIVRCRRSCIVVGATPSARPPERKFVSSMLTALGYCFFFLNDTATTEIYTLSLHDALPICRDAAELGLLAARRRAR